MISSCRIWLWMIFGMIAFMCVIALPVYSQSNLQMEHLTTEDGLSQGMIYTMLQDRDGFIWIGTKDGLNRYDGRTFKVFTNDPEDTTSISGNTVTLLYEDSKGHIWVASKNSGLNIYDKKTRAFRHIRYMYNQSGGISGNEVTSILENNDGNYIISIAGVELNIFSLDDAFYNQGIPPQVQRIQLPPQKHPLPNHPNDIRNLYKDNHENIRVVGEEYLYQLDVSKMELQEKGFTDASFCNQYIQADGTSWAFRRDGQLYYLNGKDTIYIGLVGGVGVPPHNFFIEHGTSYMLFNDSLRYFDFNPATKKISNYGSIGFGGDHNPSSMIKDRSGLLWIGTKGYGLYVLNLKSKRFNHIANGISVSDIALLNGEIVLKNYIPSWSNTDGNPPHLPDHINRLIICNILQLSDHTTFYKYYHRGLAKFFYEKVKDGKIIEFSFESYFSQEEFDPMILSRDGDIIAAGVNNKLAVIDTTDGSYQIYDLDYEIVIEAKEYHHQKPSRAEITTLYEDANKTLWVGTNQGFMTVERVSGSSKLRVSRYQNKQLDNSSLSYNHVTCFLPDPVFPEQFMWVATKGGGLNKMNLANGKFTRFSKESGLPDNVVYGVLSDDNGFIWGSTNKGIFSMRPNESSDTGLGYIFRNFRKSDGLQEDEFNTNAFLKLPDGRLVFGGVNGINVFDPKRILQDDYKPPIFITEISVNNQTLSPFDSTGLLTHSPEYTSDLTLDPEHVLLNIQYASLDFRGADQLQYRYQMKGLSEDWIQVGNQQSASFIQLAQGNYEFRVQGTNSHNQWSDQMAMMKIKVLAPWYRSSWAFLLYATLITIVLGIYLRFYLSRVKLQQQLTFEKQEANRVRELDALKTQLFTNMTHEFRTPLTIIIGMAQQVMDKPKEHFKGGMKLILNNGKNLLGLVNQILSLSKLESGKMTLDLVQSDIVLFLRNMAESFRSFAAKKEIQLHFLPEVDAVLMDFDPDKLQQIISNLISNAFKFTPDGGHIYFSVRKENEAINIRVKDTGNGIPLEGQGKIFDRFYQADNSSTREYEGTGIGLALCKNLVTLMEGQIAVQSPPVGARKGTEFSVSIPIRREALTQEPKKPKQIEPLTIEPAATESNGHTNHDLVETFAPLREKQMLHFEDAKNPLILLVEDNADVVAFIASCLGGYRLAVAENGKEGFEMAIDMIPDLIISDVMMPIMDGFELCQKLKSDARTDHVPVIILTARVDMDSKIEGLELGANAYLPKPFEKKELLLNIKNLFELRNRLRLHYQNVAGLAEALEDNLENPELRKSEDVFVIKVREFIEANLSDFNLTVEQLAKEFHLSHSQFGRKLDALTGLTPNRFIRNIRLKKSKELLLDPELSITAVAYDCGFNDPSYFTRVFKKEFGKTPLDWRSQSA